QKVETPTPVPTKVNAPINRSPAQVPPPPKKRVAFERISPTEVEAQYQFNESYFLAKDIVPIPHRSYHPSQGPVIYKGVGFNYIRSTDSASGQLSIYDSKNQVLLPLSSVIKIANTDEFKR